MRKEIMALMVALLVVGCATTDPKQQENLTSIMAGQTAVISELGEIKTSNRQLASDLGDIKASNLEVRSYLEDIKRGLGDIKATNKQALEYAQISLQIVEQMSRRQGTGEITVFFPIGSAVISKNSIEFQRLVHFADFLGRESRGRKIIFLSIGSTSAIGSSKTNLNLAKKRSEAALQVLDTYLVNIPHEFHKVYGTGDIYSPKGLNMKEHQRYQHTRIIALFDTSQTPTVNEESKSSAH